MANQVLNFDAGFRRLINKLISLGYRVDNVRPINDHRYIIIFGGFEEEKCNILASYKREPFYNFGKQFAHLGYSGVGNSINVEDLKIAMRYDVKKIYSIFPNGHCYMMDFYEFLNKSERWTTKEGKEVRSASLRDFKLEFEI